MASHEAAELPWENVAAIRDARGVSGIVRLLTMMPLAISRIWAVTGSECRGRWSPAQRLFRVVTEPAARWPLHAGRSMEPATGQVRHHAGRAFAFGVPIGTLGGLIGLGGAEFRLPVLTGVFRYPARPAVALNLAISLITVAAALTVRTVTLDTAPIVDLLPVAAAITLGAVLAAYVGVGWVHRISEVQLRRMILVLLLAIGVGLIVEAFVPGEAAGLLPDPSVVQLVVAVACGLVIGLISSLLGVAGGEVIIPTLLFVFGADIVIAGTVSLLISLPTVAVGVTRHARRASYRERADRMRTIAPMGVGSVIGAVIGGLLVGLAPQAAIKLGLGFILIYSALRVFRH